VQEWAEADPDVVIWPSLAGITNVSYFAVTSSPDTVYSGVVVARRRG
jgi:hypothetical protein